VVFPRDPSTQMLLELSVGFESQRSPGRQIFRSSWFLRRSRKHDTNGLGAYAFAIEIPEAFGFFESFLALCFLRYRWVHEDGYERLGLQCS